MYYISFSLKRVSQEAMVEKGIQFSEGLSSAMVWPKLRGWVSVGTLGSVSGRWVPGGKAGHSPGWGEVKLVGSQGPPLQQDRRHRARRTALL